MEWPTGPPPSSEKCRGKKGSQNGLRMYPELLPHQLRPISTYPDPPISHVGKIKHCVLFDIFSAFSNY